jgi:hypothetical protein
MKVEASWYGDDGKYEERWDTDTAYPMSEASRRGILSMLERMRIATIAAPPMPNDRSPGPF